MNSFYLKLGVKIVKYFVATSIILLLVSVISCVENINLSVNESDSVQVYLHKDNKLYGPFMVLPASGEYLKLKEWFKINKNGWSQSHFMPFDSTLAPIEIRGKTFVMKVINYRVYVKLDERILTKSIIKGEFQYLVDMWL